MRPSQNGNQPALDSRIARRSFGKRSRMPVKMKCPSVVMLSKGMKPALAVFAVRRDRKIQLTSKIPKRVVLGLVQVFADWKKGITHRDSAQFRDCTPRLFHHLADIRTRQHGDEL